MASAPTQAGVIPYRFVKGRPRVLLITSRTSKRWIIPKGHIEPDLTARASARMEAFEEAGVRGRIGKAAVGTYKHIVQPGTKQVMVFLMEVEEQLDNYPEADERRRRWMSVKDARKRVLERGLKRLFKNVSFPRSV